MGTTPLASYPYPDLTDPPDGPGQFLAALAAAERKDVLTFADAAARDAAITSPTAGMLVYLTTSKRLTLYNGTAWVVLVDLGGTYSPTLTNIAIGGGSGGANTALWSYSAGVLAVEGSLRFSNSGASVSGSPVVTIPPGYTIADQSNTFSARILGSAYFVDGGTSDSYGIVRINDATSVSINALTVSGSKLIRSGLSATVPFTWASTDEIKYGYTVAAVPA
jgi:hypothetical protein